LCTHQGQCIWCTFLQYASLLVLLFEVAPPGESPATDATSKLQHHGVGRRLAHRQDKRCVCETGVQCQQSILVISQIRRFLAILHPCNFARCGHYKWTLQQDRLTCQKHSVISAINAKMSIH